MKKYIGLSILVLTLGLMSCDDYLDTLPDNRMELKNPNEVSRMLTSAYIEVVPTYLTEMYSDNADEHRNTAWSAADRFQEQAYYWQDVTEIFGFETPQQIWEGAYTAVNAANIVIEYIEGLSAEEQSQHTAQLGEAYLCRAYAIFTLANTFCVAYDKATASQSLGIPYPTTLETTIDVKYERGTLAETYELIAHDIEEGIKRVGSVYDHPKFHFTPVSAHALAARFYLYYQDYEKAIEHANYVLGNDAKGKLREWSKFYSLSANGNVAPNGYVSSTENANLLLLVCYSEWGAVCGPYPYANKYAHGYNLSESETLQADAPWGNSSDMGYTVWSNGSLSKYFINKVPYDFEYSDREAGIGQSHMEIPALTTDETLLIRAEAKALSGDLAGAVEDLNIELSACNTSGAQVTLDGIKTFYDGIDYYTPTKPTPKKMFHTSFPIAGDGQEQVLQAILQLKRILFLNEGLRLQDVKRYGIVIYRRVINNDHEVIEVTDQLAEDDPRRAIQLPQDVINAGLEPNPRNK